MNIPKGKPNVPTKKKKKKWMYNGLGTYSQEINVIYFKKYFLKQLSTYLKVTKIQIKM